jgi:NADPH:quinone reductase-like Zn-dependent oxidoreductase
MDTPSTSQPTNVEPTPVADTPVVPSTMRAAVARSYGTAEVVAVEEVPTPSAAPGEVLVSVEASSMNALDWHFLTGTPYLIRLFGGLRHPKRVIHGADVAGTVVAVGSDVTTFDVGDRVFGECGGGGFAPYLTAKVGGLVPIPSGVTFDAAGATPVAGLTAVQGLRTHGATKAGEHVLINGAAGGVGTFSVQIAKALGAEVTAVCSARNVDMVARLGADHVVDYTTDDFVTGGARFDVMLDNVGNRSAAECISVLRSGARYVAVSGPKDNRWLGPIPHVARSWFAFRRADATFHQFTASPNHDDLAYLGELLASGAVIPEIERIVGLDGVADGLAEIGSGHARAKIVVTPTASADQDLA